MIVPEPEESAAEEEVLEVMLIDEGFEDFPVDIDDITIAADNPIMEVIRPATVIDSATSTVPVHSADCTDSDTDLDEQLISNTSKPVENPQVLRLTCTLHTH